MGARGSVNKGLEGCAALVLQAIEKLETGKCKAGMWTLAGSENANLLHEKWILGRLPKARFWNGLDIFCTVDL
jgi:hypothetical protein